MTDDRDVMLEERLRRLRGPDPVGDWLDVRRRARRPRRRILLIVAAAALLVAVPTVALGGRLLDVLGITASEERVPAGPEPRTPGSGTTATGDESAPVGPDSRVLAHVHGDRLYGVREAAIRLAEPLLAPLLGQEETLAVPTPDWREFVYHAWDGVIGGDGTPVLRRVDVRTGTDVEFARGAQSVAIAADGRVAFTQASQPRYENSPEGTLGGRFGHVMVASSLDAPREHWTRQQGEYVVLAWARDTLLVGVGMGGPIPPTPDHEPPAPGIYALTSADSMRPLPIRWLVAVSPDGRRVLGWWADGDSGSGQTRLVEVESGRVVSTSPTKLVRRGAWHEDRVVVSTGPNAHKLALVRIRGDEIALERMLPLAEDAALRATYGPFLGSPGFTDDGRTVTMRVASVLARDQETTETARFVGFLTCDLSSRECLRGRNLQPPTRWGAIVHNPSRPASRP
jgi:hypothetical protein